MTTSEIGAGEFLRNYDASVLRDIWYAHVMVESGERGPTKSNDLTNARSEPFVRTLFGRTVPLTALQTLRCSRTGDHQF